MTPRAFPRVTAARLRSPVWLRHYWRVAVSSGWVPDERRGEQYVVGAALQTLHSHPVERAVGIAPPYGRVFRQLLQQFPRAVNSLAWQLADWYLEQRERQQTGYGLRPMHSTHLDRRALLREQFQALVKDTDHGHSS
jgi:hypothetical protein